MTAAERIYELIKTMPEEQVQEVLAFVEILGAQNKFQTQSEIPKGTLTGLRGIAKRELTPSDQEIREEYTDYLIEKYQ